MGLCAQRNPLVMLRQRRMLVAMFVALSVSIVFWRQSLAPSAGYEPGPRELPAIDEDHMSRMPGPGLNSAEREEEGYTLNAPPLLSAVPQSGGSDMIDSRCTFGVEPYPGHEWPQLENWKRLGKNGGGIMQLHTRKTGGTSLKRIIMAICDELNPNIDRDQVEWGRFPSESCFEHNPFQKRFQSNGQALLFVGTFRDPVDRLLSDFFFRGPGALLSGTSDPHVSLPGYTTAKSVSVANSGVWEAWMSYADKSYELRKKLAGLVVPGVYFPNLATVLTSGTCTKNYTGTRTHNRAYMCPASEVTKTSAGNKYPVGCAVLPPSAYSDDEMEENLLRAKRTVVSLDAILLTSEASSPDFFASIGLQVPDQQGIERSSPRDVTPPPAVIQRMRRDARYDTELFDFAKAVHDCRAAFMERAFNNSGDI